MMKYPLTFYWARAVGKCEQTAGCARMCFIFIRPKYRDDTGLYQHELTHVKQWAFVTMICGLLIAAVYPPVIPLAIGVHGALYMGIPKYRLWCEVQAYKKQLKYYQDDRTAMFAGFIVNSYGLDMLHWEAEAMLK